jgi:hypothetical protein
VCESVYMLMVQCSGAMQQRDVYRCAQRAASRLRDVACKAGGGDGRAAAAARGSEQRWCVQAGGEGLAAPNPGVSLWCWAVTCR